jgi:adhesin transport system membrane fusion protein
MARIATWRDTWDDWDANRKLIAISAAGVLLLILWAALAQVDEVTRGMGKVIPTNKVQLVQAAEPATVSAILVRAGQSVKRGQLLVRLDDSQSSSALGQLETENQRLAQRAARLQAEGSGGNGGALNADEAALSAVRQATARSRQSALASAVEQRRRDLSEGQATINALENSARLAQDQVNMLQPLAAKGIVPQTELLSAQRELVDVQGRLSAARQGTARAAAAIREAEAQLSEARFDFRQQALNERSEVTTKIAVNEQTIRGAAARLERNELRAPVAGIVNDVQVTTVGGFVNAGEKIMQIVPIGEKLLIEARVAPKDIAFIKVGDPANVKVTAYDFSIYGGLAGTVRQISADSIYDEAEKEAYYSVIVETVRSYILSRGKRLPIVPGMICDVEIITGRKSVLTYLMKPVLKAFGEAMTER